ncbi:hypothetical protein TNCV_3451401 [Trichonephila clavipes]|uniref:Uncharacterized protein n=1 Tax=Trichonephila clavipes TaxID=2585209 RepID=A0A8X7BLI4_TRICX|nr:hypothetical protein TNCV_3451401 [Trichonephila clavipes]
MTKPYKIYAFIHQSNKVVTAMATSRFHLSQFQWYRCSKSYQIDATNAVAVRKNEVDRYQSFFICFEALSRITSEDSRLQRVPNDEKNLLIFGSTSPVI